MANLALSSNDSKLAIELRLTAYCGREFSFAPRPVSRVDAIGPRRIGIGAGFTRDTVQLVQPVVPGHAVGHHVEFPGADTGRFRGNGDAFIGLAQLRLDLFSSRVVRADQQVTDDRVRCVTQSCDRNYRGEAAAVLADVRQLINVLDTPG